MTPTPQPRAYLYLVVFPARGVFKVGKADDVAHRLRTLTRVWGEVDDYASYHVAVDRKTVLRLERTLHFVLGDFAVPEEVGDGRTELFDLRALPIALRHVELCSAARTVPWTLERGLPKVVRRSGRRPRTLESRLRDLQRDALRAAASEERTIAQFAYADRLLVVLARKQHKVPFEWELAAGRLCFRFRAETRGVRFPDARSVLGVQCYDARGRLHSILWEMLRDREVVQYRVMLPWLIDPEHAGHPLLLQLWSETQRLLMTVPRRSAAARRQIPRLL